MAIYVNTGNEKKNLHLNCKNPQKFISTNRYCNIMVILTMKQPNDTKSLETGKSKILSYVLLTEMIKCASSRSTTLSKEIIILFHIKALIKSCGFFDMQMSSEEYGVNELPKCKTNLLEDLI